MPARHLSRRWWSDQHVAGVPFASLSTEQLSALRSLLTDQWFRDYPEHLLADRTDELAAATTRRRRRRAHQHALVKG